MITLLTAPLFCDEAIYSKNMSMNKHYSRGDYYVKIIMLMNCALVF